MSGRWRVLAAAATAVICLLSANPLNAYTTMPLAPLHEMMTRLAVECSARRSSPSPLDCRDAYPRLLRLTGHRRWLGNSFSPLERAARWPDDPLREMGWGWAWDVIGRGCAGEEQRQVDEAGLLCSSHLGRLQYLHAMKSSAGEDRRRTHQRMMDWARFTYKVAAGTIPTERGLCRVLTEIEADGRRFSIADDFARPGSRFCGDGRAGSEWTVGRLFTLCAGGRSCATRTPEQASAQARTAATGALLHMIQDSYSQSHAARGGRLDPEQDFEPVIACEFPIDFYHYSAEDSGGHKAADKRPRLAETCDGAGVHDPITASATVLRHLRDGSGWEDVEQYLIGHVLGPVPA